MEARRYFGLLIILHMSIFQIFSAPIEEKKNMEKRSISNNGYYNENVIFPESRNVKKHVFLSRGWGAGGMPFSVLYMSPHSSKAPMEQYYKPMQITSRPKEESKPKSLPLIATRNTMSTVRGPGRKSYSIIPQLFVSYGWGPQGK